MLKKKNGTIAALTLSFVLILGGGVFAYEEIQEKEEMVAVQKENLSQLETEKEALEKDKATKEKVIADKDKAIEETKNTLSDKEKALKEKEEALKEKENAIKSKDEQIQELKEDLSAKAKRKEEELKNKKEVVVASVAPTSSVVQASAKKEETIVPSRSNDEPSGRTFYVEATAYVALCDTGCTGITATGINLLQNPGLKVIAVDPSVIPLGSKVHVEGYGYAIAGDTGGAIKGNRIDLYVQNHSDAVAYGRQQIKVTILE